MNMNTLVNMFTRLIVRRAMNWGITKGMSTLSRGRGKPADRAQGAPKAPVQPGKDQDMARKMRTLNRLNRR